MTFEASPVVFRLTSDRYRFAWDLVVLIVPVSKKGGTTCRERHRSCVTAFGTAQVSLGSIENGCFPRMAVPTLPPRFVSRFCIELLGKKLVLFLIPLFGERWIKTLKAGRCGRLVSETIGTSYHLEAIESIQYTANCRFCDWERSESSDLRGCGISTILAS